MVVCEWVCEAVVCRCTRARTHVTVFVCTCVCVCVVHVHVCMSSVHSVCMYVCI